MGIAARAAPLFPPPGGGAVNMRALRRGRRRVGPIQALSPPTKLPRQVLVEKFNIQPASMDAPEEDLKRMMQNK